MRWTTISTFPRDGKIRGADILSNLERNSLRNYLWFVLCFLFCIPPWELSPWVDSIAEHNVMDHSTWWIGRKWSTPAFLPCLSLCFLLHTSRMRRDHNKRPSRTLCFAVSGWIDLASRDHLRLAVHFHAYFTGHEGAQHYGSPHIITPWQVARRGWHQYCWWVPPVHCEWEVVDWMHSAGPLVNVSMHLNICICFFINGTCERCPCMPSVNRERRQSVHKARKESWWHAAHMHGLLFNRTFWMLWQHYHRRSWCSILILNLPEYPSIISFFPFSYILH